MRPVASLTTAAKAIAASRDPSVRLPEPVAEDEVAELSKTLQQMLSSLDESQSERAAALQKQREFLADASHELRTPLTSVLANLELLEVELESSGSDEDQEIVASAVRSSRRMSRLVSDLLLLAKSDAGQHRPQADYDLAEIARSACSEVGASLGDRILEVHLNSAPLHGTRTNSTGCSSTFSTMPSGIRRTARRSSSLPISTGRPIRRC
jgi:two-component system OmpR family sensor kinase